MPGFRFDPTPVIRGHWMGLTDGRLPSAPPDVASRITIIVLPIATVVATLVWDWTLQAAAALLAGVSLLAGGMLSAFTHLGSLRLKVTEWTDQTDDDALDSQADMLDESAAHLLMASLVALADAVLLVIGMNVAGEHPISGWWAAVIIGASVYLALLFFLCVPRLYAAYVEINRVRDNLNGFVRRH